MVVEVGERGGEFCMADEVGAKILFGGGRGESWEALAGGELRFAGAGEAGSGDSKECWRFSYAACQWTHLGQVKVCSRKRGVEVE